METPNLPQIPNKPKRSKNLTLKALMIAALTLLLLVPGIFIQNLVNERSTRQTEVEEEISQKWASQQLVQGPYLIIPYKHYLSDAKTSQEKRCFVLPEELNVNGTITPEIKHRSLFKTTVYQSDLLLKGSFTFADLEDLGINIADLDLDKAKVFIGISDFKGIAEHLKLQWNNASYELLATTINEEMISMKGFSASVHLTPEDLAKTCTFSLPMQLKGSKSLSFLPLGKTTAANLKSEWQTPSFFGNFLPEKTIDYKDKGFDATWKVLYINRDYPQVWRELKDVKDSSFGVSLIQTSNSYYKIHRAAKYMLLFVSLTFALFFFMEILQKKKIHVLQYTLVGLALAIFYVLLLSCSEYIGFNWAYLVAALATILLIAFYAKSAFDKWNAALVFGSVLSCLYTFIYVLIQLEDTALLIGSIGLFVLIAIIMYYTRKIDWNNQ